MTTPKRTLPEVRESVNKLLSDLKAAAESITDLNSLEDIEFVLISGVSKFKIEKPRGAFPG